MKIIPSCESSCKSIFNISKSQLTAYLKSFLLSLPVFFESKVGQKFLFILAFIGLSLFFLVFFSNFSFAGTGGTELKTVYEKTIALAQGYGGKLAAGVAFVISLVAAVRGNLMAFGSALGVSVLAGVGPEIFTSGVSAII